MGPFSSMDLVLVGPVCQTLLLIVVLHLVIFVGRPHLDRGPLVPRFLSGQVLMVRPAVRGLTDLPPTAALQDHMDLQDLTSS